MAPWPTLQVPPLRWDGTWSLLEQQARGAEGLELLAECYGWFTEVFDTVNLREAR